MPTLADAKLAQLREWWAQEGRAERWREQRKERWREIYAMPETDKRRIGYGYWSVRQIFREHALRACPTDRCRTCDQGSQRLLATSPGLSRSLNRRAGRTNLTER